MGSAKYILNDQQMNIIQEAAAILNLDSAVHHDNLAYADVIGDVSYRLTDEIIDKIEVLREDGEPAESYEEIIEKCGEDSSELVNAPEMPIDGVEPNIPILAIEYADVSVEDDVEDYCFEDCGDHAILFMNDYSKRKPKYYGKYLVVSKDNVYMVASYHKGGFIDGNTYQLLNNKEIKGWLRIW